MFLQFALIKTMIEWKEHEHELDDIVALQNPQTRAALRNCGLLKYFKLQKMKKEVLLLEYIIGLWDDVEQAFQIGPQMLKIELDDVYFLTGLSRRGAPIILFQTTGNSFACRGVRGRSLCSGVTIGWRTNHDQRGQRFDTTIYLVFHNQFGR
jgi:hypothetical protein